MGLTQLQGPHPVLLPTGEGTLLHEPYKSPLSRRERVGVRALKLREAHPPRITYTNRDWVFAALMNEVNSGWGSNSLDFSSGWNWTPTNQG